MDRRIARLAGAGVPAVFAAEGASARTAAGRREDLRARPRRMARRLVLAPGGRRAARAGAPGLHADPDRPRRAPASALARHHARRFRRRHRQPDGGGGTARRDPRRPQLRRHRHQRRGGPHAGSRAPPRLSRQPRSCEPGQSPFGILPAEVVAARRKLVAEQGGGVAIPPPPALGVASASRRTAPSWPGCGAASHRTRPAPTKARSGLRNPVGNGRPCTYIACTAPLYAPLEAVRQWVKRQSGWRWQEIATGHDAMVTAPAELSRMLLAVA